MILTDVDLLSRWQTDGATPLFAAAQAGSVTLVDELIGRGAVVDASRVSQPDGVTHL